MAKVRTSLPLHPTEYNTPERKKREKREKRKEAWSRIPSEKKKKMADTTLKNYRKRKEIENRIEKKKKSMGLPTKTTKFKYTK